MMMYFTPKNVSLQQTVDPIGQTGGSDLEIFPELSHKEYDTQTIEADGALISIL